MIIKTILLLLLTSLLQAEMLLSPFDAIQSNIEGVTKIEKKNLLLNSSKASYVEKKAKLKLKSKIFRTFKVYKKGTIIAYAILVPRKVRSKNGVALYIFSTKKELLAVEIVAFNEPREFIPKKSWLKQFQGQKSAETLRVGKGISTISGATLSARSVTDGARVAAAVLDTIIK